MSVKFKAKQPWSGTFFKDRMNWLGCHEKLFVLATIPWPHSFFPLLHFFLLVTSHLSKNWSRVYVQGVPNYFSLSGRPGTACDFAFAVLMDLPIQGRVRPRRFVFSCGQHYQASSGIAAVDAADPLPFALPFCPFTRTATVPRTSGAFQATRLLSKMHKYAWSKYSKKERDLYERI